MEVNEFSHCFHAHSTLRSSGIDEKVRQLHTCCFCNKRIQIVGVYVGPRGHGAHHPDAKMQFEIPLDIQEEDCPVRNDINEPM